MRQARPAKQACWTVAWATWLLLQAGCGTPTTPPLAPPDVQGKDIKGDAVDAAVDATAADAPDEDLQPDTQTLDVVDVEAPDESATDAAADLAECTTDTDCDKLTLGVCDSAACIGGVCKIVTKSDVCCGDAACDDKDVCTVDHCDMASHLCGHDVIANCCAGKKLLGDYDFEAGMSGDFIAAGPPGNGTVVWQASTTRSHSGKSSLYFGNPCHNYDTSSAVVNSCNPGKAAAVSTTLTSKTFSLPKGIGAQLHFWLWLDTEPPYADSVPQGACIPGCGPTDSCVMVGGSAQCIPEKDVLTLSLQVGGQTLPLFYSTQIGKSTKGVWQHIAVDIGAWAGQDVAAKWSFATGTGIKNDYEGIYLDDIRIETACQGNASAACSQDVPCPNDGLQCTADTCTYFQNFVDEGWCYHDKVTGCCTADAECSDGNDCTLDACTSGTCAFTPDASKPACCKSEVLLFDDFDTPGLDAWTASGGNSGTVKWQSDPGGGPDKSGALCFGNAACNSYDDPSLGMGAGPKGALCTKVAKLKTGTVFNLLSFELLLDTEWSDVLPASYKNPLAPGNPKVDFFSVDLYFDASLHPAWSSDAIDGTTSGKWLPVTIPLDAWQGKSVQVCLRFDAGDGQVNDKKGVHIDNFVLKVACAKKPCYWDNECAALSCGACSAPACTETGCACVTTPGCE